MQMRLINSVVCKKKLINFLSVNSNFPYTFPDKKIIVLSQNANAYSISLFNVF